MAIFRVKVRFEQEVEVDVQASAPREAESLALDKVRENRLAPGEARSSVRPWIEIVEGATQVVGS